MTELPSRTTSPDPPGSVRLSLCMIVRNNERTLPAVLHAALPFVDELVVVDTGSTDRTREICRDYGARLVEFAWRDDFAAARNVSIEQATGGWLCYLDSDDLIDRENGHRLRSFVEQSHPADVWGAVVDVITPPSQAGWDASSAIGGQVRLFRRRDDVRFEGRLHESVLTSIHRGGGRIVPSGVSVRHALADQSPAGRQAKAERDLRILQAMLETNPADGSALFHLALTRQNLGDLKGARETLDRYLGIEPHGRLRRKAWSLLATTLLRLARTDDALGACRTGLAEFPRDAELSFIAGTIHQAAGRLRAAQASYQTTLAGECGGRLRAIDQGLLGFKTHYNLASVLHRMGKTRQAELQLLDALNDRPDFEPAWRLLGHVLFDRGKWAEAEVHARRMTDWERLQPLAAIWQANIAVGRDRFAHAAEILTEATARWPENAELAAAHCQHLIRQKDWTRADDAFQLIRQKFSTETTLMHRLTRVLRETGNEELAARWSHQLAGATSPETR